MNYEQLFADTQNKRVDYHGDPVGILKTIQALGQINNERSFYALVNVVSTFNQNSATRYDCDAVYPAIQILQRLNDPRAFNAFVKALKFPQDGGWAVPVEAAIALGRLGDKRAIKPLKEAVRRPEAQVRQAAQQALKQLGGSSWW